jgi:hypothetical protein
MSEVALQRVHTFMRNKEYERSRIERKKSFRKMKKRKLFSKEVRKSKTKPGMKQ